MLGYVFWHHPLSGVEFAEYEKALSAFQRALITEAPEGLLGSASFAMGSVHWFPAEQTYLDWYAVADFSSLGKLNEAAVSGLRKTPHDQVARLAGAGTGGVFKLAAGRAALEEANFGTWLSKPAGKTYASFFDDVSPLVEAVGASLWQRQMSLGPGPEFCIHTSRRIDVPDRFSPVVIEFRRI